MPIKYFLVVASLLLSGSCLAQAQADDHLTPPQGILSNPSSADYKALVRRKLAGEGTHRFSLAQVIAIPSFQPEYSLSVEQISWQVYVLTYRRAQTSLWSATQPQVLANARQPAKNSVVPLLIPPQPGAADSSGITTIRVKLAPTLGQALVDLFNVAIAQTRYPIYQYLRGDGTTFTFLTSQAGLGHHSGETWSPAPRTNMGQLVEIVGALREVAAPTSNHEYSQALLLKDVQALIFQLASR